MRRALKWTGIGCGGVIGVLVLFTIVGALVGRSSPPQPTAVPAVIAVQATIAAATPAPAAPPTAAPSKPTEPPPSPTEAPPPAPERLVITGAGADGVNMRAEPSATAARVKLLKDGAALEVTGENRDADDRTWRNVKDVSDGATGWVAADFVTAPGAPPAAASAPQPTSPPKPGPAAPTAVQKQAVPAKPSTGRAAPVGKNCPAGFLVKGNQGSRSTNDWIYHVPGSNSYAATDPEECFATAADAQAAGYRAPQR